MINSNILVIYPSEYSTKVAIYQNITTIFFKNIIHKPEDLEVFPEFTDQLDFRVNAIINDLKQNEIDLNSIKIIITRGGLTKPLKSGVYQINKKMIADLSAGLMGKHAVNLSGLIAEELIKFIPEAKAYIADAVVVDELADIARITGHPLLEKKSIFHAANHKHIARKYSLSINRHYEDLNLIVAYMGIGVSVGAHQKGKVVDVNQAFDGDGPLSITRTGTLPAGDLVKLCFSGKYSEKQILHMITHEGGLKAYLKTDSQNEIEKKFNMGDDKAIMLVNAMAYQVAKEIGAMFTVLEGEVDAIILSGEFFHFKAFSDQVTKRINKIAKISVFPTVNDMDALAYNALQILKGETNAWEYI
jgi:butyrate kinase